jgi:pilus assembly protein CpaF
VLSPVSIGGTTVSIRRAREVPLHLDDLIAFGTLNREMGDLLVRIIRSRLNMVISGGAGVGKTTLLNVLSASIPHEERIVTIEETAELRMDHPHVVSLETRLPNAEGIGGIDLRTLVKNALRMRADRVIIGEVRGAEAFEMLQAMQIGHDGSLTTVHGSAPGDALRRLETLVLTGGGEIPAAAVAEIVASSIHVVIQMTRFSDGTRRIETIAEVEPVETGFTVREIFSYSRASGHFGPGPALDEFQTRLKRREKE